MGSTDCPFDAGQFALRNPTLDPPEPLPVQVYTRADRLDNHNVTRWPEAADHARRHEWGPEWRIGPAGFSAGLHSDGGERTLFVAYRDDRPPPPEGVTPAKYTGPEWRFFVDLDRGLWRDWTCVGEWQPVSGQPSAVSGQPEKEEIHERIPDSDFRRCAVENDSGEIQDKKAGVGLARLCEVGVASHAGPSPIREKHRKGSGFCLLLRNEFYALSWHYFGLYDRGVFWDETTCRPIAKPPVDQPSTINHQPSASPHPLGPGWRTVIDDGKTVGRFGPDTLEEMPAWKKTLPQRTPPIGSTSSAGEAARV